MLWRFSKYVGSGNDFVFFDNRQRQFPIDARLIQRLCHRQEGIGADGVILLQTSSKADFNMRIFNSDGGEAEMCGNGMRCLMLFLDELGYKEPSYRIEASGKMLKVKRQGWKVCVEMSDPEELAWDIPLSWNGITQQLHHLNTGVPHVVVFVDEIETWDIEKWGKHVRHHPRFSPKGVNGNAAQILANGEIVVRTYERGVEAETLACGTGATAVALAAARQLGIKSPVRIKTRSQEILEIGFSQDQDRFTNVTLSGPARRTYSGEVDI